MPFGTEKKAHAPALCRDTGPGKNDDFDLVKRREIESVKNLLGQRIKNNTGFHFFRQLFLSSFIYSAPNSSAKAFFNLLQVED